MKRNKYNEVIQRIGKKTYLRMKTSRQRNLK